MLAFFFGGFLSPSQKKKKTCWADWSREVFLAMASYWEPPFTGLMQERLVVESLEKWRAEMGIEEMVLCGHSLGGMISSAYAMAHPHRCVLASFRSRISCPRKVRASPGWVGATFAMFRMHQPQGRTVLGECFEPLHSFFSHASSLGSLNRVSLCGVCPCTVLRGRNLCHTGVIPC